MVLSEIPGAVQFAPPNRALIQLTAPTGRAEIEPGDPGRCAQEALRGVAAGPRPWVVGVEPMALLEALLIFDSMAFFDSMALFDAMALFESMIVFEPMAWAFEDESGLERLYKLRKMLSSSERHCLTNLEKLFLS